MQNKHSLALSQFWARKKKTVLFAFFSATGKLRNNTAGWRRFEKARRSKTAVLLFAHLGWLST
jgi:hypothetical protein